MEINSQKSSIQSYFVFKKLKESAKADQFSSVDCHYVCLSFKKVNF